LAILSVALPAFASVYSIVPLAIFGVVFAFYTLFWGGVGWLFGQAASDTRTQPQSVSKAKEEGPRLGGGQHCSSCSRNKGQNCSLSGDYIVEPDSMTCDNWRE
jgi:hypothetical protein